MVPAEAIKTFREADEGEQGGDGEADGEKEKRNRVEICSVNNMVLGDECRSQRPDG